VPGIVSIWLSKVVSRSPTAAGKIAMATRVEVREGGVDPADWVDLADRSPDREIKVGIW